VVLGLLGGLFTEILIVTDLEQREKVRAASTSHRPPPGAGARLGVGIVLGSA